MSSDVYKNDDAKEQLRNKLKFLGKLSQFYFWIIANRTTYYVLWGDEFHSFSIVGLISILFYQWPCCFFFVFSCNISYRGVLSKWFQDHLNMTIVKTVFFLRFSPWHSEWCTRLFFIFIHFFIFQTLHWELLHLLYIFVRLKLLKDTG